MPLPSLRHLSKRGTNTHVQGEARGKTACEPTHGVGMKPRATNAHVAFIVLQALLMQPVFAEVPPIGARSFVESCRRGSRRAKYAGTCTARSPRTGTPAPPS